MQEAAAKALVIRSVPIMTIRYEYELTERLPRGLRGS
jgi:hypothetical protein